VNYSAHKLSVP